jgi:hypothetical protein
VVRDRPPHDEEAGLLKVRNKALGLGADKLDAPTYRTRQAPNLRSRHWRRGTLVQAETAWRSIVPTGSKSKEPSRPVHGFPGKETGNAFQWQGQRSRTRDPKVFFSALERAFQLARSGEMSAIADIEKQLDREGYDRKVVQGGPLLKGQLRKLIREASERKGDQKVAPTLS